MGGTQELWMAILGMGRRGVNEGALQTVVTLKVTNSAFQSEGAGRAGAAKRTRGVISGLSFLHLRPKLELAVIERY